MPFIKNTDRAKCVWHRLKNGKPHCAILTEMCCYKKNKCSFYETEEDYKVRQADFKERHGYLIWK